MSEKVYVTLMISETCDISRFKEEFTGIKVLSSCTHLMCFNPELLTFFHPNVTGDAQKDLHVEHQHNWLIRAVNPQNWQKAQ